MNTNRTIRTRPILTALASAALCFGLSACFEGDDDDDVAVPAPTPTPTPTPTSATFDVSKCIGQSVPGTGGTVADLVIPDVIRIDPTQPSGFPNGRLLTDPVIDVILAALFLDINAAGQSPLTFASIPLNPAANDVSFRPDFPYLAPPQGTPPIASGNGANFNFRTDAAQLYVRVDRTGFPAVSTALIPAGSKLVFNDAGPVADLNGQFVGDITATLTALTEGIGDDLLTLNLNICAD